MPSEAHAYSFPRKLTTSHQPTESPLTRAGMRRQRLADVDEVVLSGACTRDRFPVVTVPRQGREVVVVASLISAGKRTLQSGSAVSYLSISMLSGQAQDVGTVLLDILGLGSSPGTGLKTGPLPPSQSQRQPKFGKLQHLVQHNYISTKTSKHQA